MKRPNFLSNKKATCDFCESESYGNLNKDNLIMCWQCVNNLCDWSDGKKLRFLAKFKGRKEKENLIKRFINEEVLDGTETRKSTKDNSRVVHNRKNPWLTTDKIWTP